jgi:hypothetical protein
MRCLRIIGTRWSFNFNERQPRRPLLRSRTILHQMVIKVQKERIK